MSDDAENIEKALTGKKWREMLHEAGNLVRLCEGSEEALSRFSNITAQVIASYDLEKILSIFNDLCDLNTIFESNTLLDHARLKCTLLLYQQLLRQTKGEILAIQNTVSAGTTDLFYDLLTNLFLSEEVAEWNNIQEYLFPYMGETPDARIQINDYAGMLSFMSINVDLQKHGQMLSMAKRFLDAFPTTPGSITGYGYVLYSGMNFLEEERSGRCRKELTQLIQSHPENGEILQLYVENTRSVGSNEDILNLLERKEEIETDLRIFLDTKADLIRQYVKLLEKISKQQTMPDTIRTMQTLDNFLQKHPENEDVKEAYASVLKILAEKSE